MTRSWIRCASAAGALALTLTLAAPAQAAGWTLSTHEPGIVQAAWQWLTHFWPALLEENGGSQPFSTKIDGGGGIDPNGLAATLPCQQGCGRSGGIDPNG